MFALGFIAGIMLSTLVFVILAFFRAGIEKRVRIIETVLQQAGPKQKGFIIEPEDEGEKVRRKIIEENDKRGIDTKISDLM